ncbi:MAG: amidohydrolase [Clostridiales bacterium]|nr:amidohydrolase [Clostridiales bacterium]
MIIDVQHHAMPRSVFEKFHDPSLPPKRVFTNGIDFVFNPRLCMFDEHLRAMDGAGVDMALLSISQFANVMGKDLCREINEGFAEEVAKNPDRFCVAGCFPQDDIEAAVDEIEYMVKELKFPAITMLTSMSPEITLSSEEHTFPIYEKCAELGVPIFLHVHLNPFGSEKVCTINRSLARGFDAAKAALRLIYDVLPKFPTLDFVMPHFCGAFLALKGRSVAFSEVEGPGVQPVEEQYKNLPKTPLEVKELGWEAAFDERFNRLYIDGAGSGGWPPMTEMAFRVVNHDRLMFATDYPYEVHTARDYKYYIDSLDAMDISEEDKKAFLGGNAARLLKLNK